MDKYIATFVVFILFVSCRFPVTNALQNNQCKSNNFAERSIPDSIDSYKLIQNKWYYVVGPDCVSYLTFQQDFRYKEENCEWGLFYNGNYKISKDSIILYEYDLVTNSPNEDRIVNTYIYTYIYQGNRLKLVNTRTVKDGIEVNTYFPDSVFYYRFEE